MSKKVLKAGLIGIGGYGATHFELLSHLAAEGLIKIAAVADPTLDRLPDMRAKLQDTKIPTFQSDEEMRDTVSDLDFVVISSPIPLHDEMIRRWLATNAWIYLEKPPVPTIQQLREVIALDKNNRVRVGFQMIYMQSMRRLKQWALEGKLGEIQRISVVAAWPRTLAYYQRNKWAGKLMINGKPVFDGPATNAISHVVHNTMFVVGESPESFAIPEQLQGSLYRARDMESYDLFTLTGSFSSQIQLNIGLTHCVNAMTQAQLRVKGSKASAHLDHGTSLLTCTDGTSEYPDQQNSPIDSRTSIYKAFLNAVHGKDEEHATTLADCIPYSLATCGALISSGGIHTIPNDFKRAYGIDEAAGIAVSGLNEALLHFGKTGESLVEQNIAWAKTGQSIQTSAIQSIDLLRYS